MINNVEADHEKQRGGSHPRKYWRRLVFPAFIDYLLQELDTRFIVITGKAVLGLKRLSSNVGELTGANINDLQE